MNAWVGIIGGGIIGGVLGAALTKAAFKHVDLGVTGASAAAFALIGGALTAAKPASDTTATATNMPTS
jgi:hypothetical protein